MKKADINDYVIMTYGVEAQEVYRHVIGQGQQKDGTALTDRAARIRAASRTIADAMVGVYTKDQICPLPVCKYVKQTTIKQFEIDKTACVQAYSGFSNRLIEMTIGWMAAYMISRNFAISYKRLLHLWLHEFSKYEEILIVLELAGFWFYLDEDQAAA